MPFTEGTLATFMATQLGATGRALFGATPATSDEIVSQVAWVVSILGSPIASLTDDLRTMTVATWRAWVAARAASANDRDLKAGTSAIDASQRFDHIERALRDAEAAALRYAEVRVLIGGALPVPYAGGLSRSEKRDRARNTDRVAPFFGRDLHEPIGTGSEVD